MLKKVLIGLGIVVLIIAILVIWAMARFSPDGNKVAEFLEGHSDKSAISFYRNDSLLIERNADRIMPLASTVKIIVAIEYAEQAASGLVDADEMIPVEDLGRYYVPNTDGGAHPAWLKASQGKITAETIQLREVAKGMIRFSSNANTEYLLDRLGLDRINARLDSLGIQQHDSLYYIVSALFGGQEKFPGLTGEKLARALQGVSMPEYRQICRRVHQKLKSDSSYSKAVPDLPLKVQRIWSDRLPGSTTREYAALVRKINRRVYFRPEVHTYLKEVMERVMRNPAKQSSFKHAGMKGGSTAFVLTKANYATDLQGNTTELVYFFNDLSPIENLEFQQSLKDFEFKMLKDPVFRKEVVESLK